MPPTVFMGCSAIGESVGGQSRVAERMFCTSAGLPVCQCRALAQHTAFGGEIPARDGV